MITDKNAIINKCTVRSEAIIIAKAARITLRNTNFYLNRLLTTLPSQKHIKELDVELLNIIDMYEKEIAGWLKPIFDENEIKFKNNYWFSGSDLQNGYVLTTPDRHFGSIEYVLFLTSAIDVIGQIIEKGSVKPLKEVESILSTVKSIDKNNIFVTIKHALRTLDTVDENH